MNAPVERRVAARVDPDAVVDQIKGTLRLLVAATVVVFVLVLYVGGRGYLDAAKTTDSLCALRSDLETRVQGSRDFLKANPKGLPGLASAAQLRESIANQQRTITALHSLDC